MEERDGIPADIMEEAREAWWPHHPSRTRDTALADLDAGSTGEVLVEFADVLEIVRSAITAERKRCARIADDYAKRAWSAHPSAQEAAVAAEKIAGAIRNP